MEGKKDSEYCFYFPNANLFLQSLIDVTPVGEYITLAWEIDTKDQKPQYFLIQAVMAREETALTERYRADWVLQDQVWKAPPTYSKPMSVHPLTLRTCSCGGGDEKNDHLKSVIEGPGQILEICSFNPTSILPQIKKELRGEDLDQLAIKGNVNLVENSIELMFLSVYEEKQEAQDRLSFYNQLVENLSHKTPPVSASPLSEFFQQNSWTEKESEHLIQHLKEPSKVMKKRISEVLINRNLCIPTFTYPYMLPEVDTTTFLEEEKETSCYLCEILESNDMTSLKVDAIDRWQRKYEEEEEEQERRKKQVPSKSQHNISDAGYPIFPLAPMILHTIEEVKQQLKKKIPVLSTSQHANESRACPVMSQGSAYLDCELLLPALQHCSRELQLASSLGIYYFNHKDVIFFAEGEMGSIRFLLEQINKEMQEQLLKNSNSLTFTSKVSVLPFYKMNYGPTTPFHIEIPLRQFALFPKLTTTQNQFLNPHYVRLRIKSNWDYIQFSASTSENKIREIFQLIFSYHKLQQACLTTDLSEESANENS